MRFSWSKVSSCPSNRLVSIGSGSRPRPSPRTGDLVAAAVVGPAPLGRFGGWGDLQAAAGRVDQRACLARTRRGHCERGARRQPVVVMKSGDVPRRKSRRTSFWAMAGSWCDEIRGTWLAQARPRRLGVLTMHPYAFPNPSARSVRSLKCVWRPDTAPVGLVQGSISYPWTAAKMRPWRRRGASRQTAPPRPPQGREALPVRRGLRHCRCLSLAFEIRAASRFAGAPATLVPTHASQN